MIEDPEDEIAVIESFAAIFTFLVGGSEIGQKLAPSSNNGAGARGACPGPSISDVRRRRLS